MPHFCELWPIYSKCYLFATVNGKKRKRIIFSSIFVQESDAVYIGFVACIRQFAKFYCTQNNVEIYGMFI